MISRQSITGEQGEKFCKTLPAPFERPDSGFEEALSIEKNKLRALVYHVTNSTYKKSHCKLKCYTDERRKITLNFMGFIIPYYMLVLLQRLISSRERLKRYS